MYGGDDWDHGQYDEYLKTTGVLDLVSTRCKAPTAHSRGRGFDSLRVHFPVCRIAATASEFKSSKTGYVQMGLTKRERAEEGTASAVSRLKARGYNYF